MPEARRNQRGLILIPLGVAVLAAATGAMYWYFNRNSWIPDTPTHRHSPTKRKSIVIVLTQVTPSHGLFLMLRTLKNGYLAMKRQNCMQIYT